MAGLVRGILCSSWRGFSSSSSLYLTSVFLCSTSRKSGKQLGSLYPFILLSQPSFDYSQSVMHTFYHKGYKICDRVIYCLELLKLSPC